MTERHEPYVITPGAALAQHRGCQQALSRTLRELAGARAEIEVLRADEQRRAADWLTEFAEMTDDQVARRHLLVAAECIRDMGDWHGYEMHPVAISELERQIRQSERERCANIAAGFGGTGCGATIANAICTREEP